MPLVDRVIEVASLGAVCVLTGCASAYTTIVTTGTALNEPLCQANSPAVSVAIFWATQWRTDQKEPALREAAALRGIQDFLTRSRCVALAGVRHLAAEDAPPPNDELLRLAAAMQPPPERIVLIVVRELGPRLVVGSPVIVEGGTEVVVDVRVLDTRTSRLLADSRTIWRNGGSFVIKGVGTLDQDMSAALTAAFMPGGVPE